MKRVIVISGLPGAGSSTTAKTLAQKLGLDYFSPGRLYKDIARGEFDKQSYASLFKEICKKKGLKIPSLAEKNDSNGTLNFWNTAIGKDSKFHEAIDELQTVLAKKGNIVLDGKLSIFIIKNAKPKIWLNCSLKERARRAAQRDNIPQTQALSVVKKRQEIEKKEWEKIYGKNPEDQEKEADIIIDTTKLSAQETCKKIMSKMTNL